jgi:hypothetical protein
MKNRENVLLSFNRCGTSLQVQMIFSLVKINGVYDLLILDSAKIKQGCCGKFLFLIV